MLAMGALQTVLDSLAASVSILDTALGVDGTVAGTVGYGAAQNVATLRAIADADVQAEVMPTFRARQSSVLAPSHYLAFGGTAIHRALDYHYAKWGAGDLNRQLAAFGLRVHPNLRKIGMSLDAPNVFVSPAIDPVATFAVTGAGLGILANLAAAIDENYYAAAALSLVTTSAIGATPIVASITVRDAGGSASVQVVNIGAGTANGTAIPVPGRHYGVTGIVIAGGTNGDSFKITAPLERAINL